MNLPTKKKKPKHKGLLSKIQQKEAIKQLQLLRKKKFGNHWIQGPRFCDRTVAGLNPVEC